MCGTESQKLACQWNAMQNLHGKNVRRDAYLRAARTADSTKRNQNARGKRLEGIRRSVCQFVTHGLGPKSLEGLECLGVLEIWSATE